MNEFAIHPIQSINIIQKSKIPLYKTHTHIYIYILTVVNIPFQHKKIHQATGPCLVGPSKAPSLSGPHQAQRRHATPLCRADRRGANEGPVIVTQDHNRGEVQQGGLFRGFTGSSHWKRLKMWHCREHHPFFYHPLYLMMGFSWWSNGFYRHFDGTWWLSIGKLYEPMEV